MGWYFDGTNDVQITNNSALDIPNSDWTFCGWFRKSNNAGTNYERIFAWGTPGATSHIQVYVPNISAAGSNADNLSARVIDPSSADTGFIYNVAFTLSSTYDLWIPWCLTHDNATNNNYLRVMRPDNRVTYNASAVRGLSTITTTNIPGPLYIGSTNVGGLDRFKGDLAEFAFLPGVFFDTDLWNSFTNGARPGRFHGCKYYLPMNDGRYESWNTKLTVTNGGSVASGSHAPVQLLVPKHPNEDELAPAAGGLRVSKQSVDVFGTKPSDMRFVTQALNVAGLTDPVLEVSSLSLEYLTQVGVKEAGATSTIALSQEALVNVQTLTASSTLSLGQTAAAENIELPATNVTIPLTQQADVTLWPVATAASTLVVTQDASYDLTFFRSAESPLNIFQEATYIGPKYVSAASVIQLEHYVYQPETHEVSAESHIDFTQTIRGGGTKRLFASSHIDLAGIADNIIKIRSAESQLVISQSASVDKILTASSHINLTQSAQLGQVTKSAESVLNLTHEARYQPLPQTAESHLEFTQYAHSSLRSVSASSHIELSHSNYVQKPIRAEATSTLTEYGETVDPYTGYGIWGELRLRGYASVVHIGGVSAESNLSFRQTVGLTHVKASGTPVSAFSTLTPTHAATLSKTGEALNTINLTQTALGWAGRPGESQLILSQEASYTITQSPTASNTIPLKQAATFTLELAGTKCQYSPFVGSTTDPDAPAPPPLGILGPMTGIQVPFQLVYPSTGTVTDAVSLKTPNLGNVDRLTFNRIQRETRGGTLIVYSDPIWPKLQTMALTFSGLHRAEAVAVLEFMNDHVGLEIGLIDWEHRYWRGVITTPDEPIVQDGRDAFTASFEFQGELDPTWNPVVVPLALRYSPCRSPQENGVYVPVQPELPPEVDYLVATADSVIQIGNAIYIKFDEHLDLAKADANATMGAVGLSLSDTGIGADCQYLTDGQVERSDWAPITGNTLLSPGVVYYLSAASAGKMTTTAPTAVGQFVRPLGRAVSTTVFDIEIATPVLL